VVGVLGVGGGGARSPVGSIPPLDSRIYFTTRARYKMILERFILYNSRVVKNETREFYTLQNERGNFDYYFLRLERRCNI
jgi:hypothetical protein